VDAGYNDLFSPDVLAEKLNQHTGMGDVDEKISDPLKRFPVWWIVEVFPTKFSFIDSNNQWKTKRNVNLRRERLLPPGHVLHESVDTYRNRNTWYTPKATRA